MSSRCLFIVAVRIWTHIPSSGLDVLVAECFDAADPSTEGYVIYMQRSSANYSNQVCAAFFAWVVCDELSGDWEAHIEVEPVSDWQFIFYLFNDRSVWVIQFVDACLSCELASRSVKSSKDEDVWATWDRQVAILNAATAWGLDRLD